MTNCRLSLLAVTAALVCSLARAQTPFESSRNTVPPGTQTGPVQQGRSIFGGNQPGVSVGQRPAEGARNGWLQRLVFGKSDDSANNGPGANTPPLMTNAPSGGTVPFAPPQSSRQPSAIAAQTPTAPASRPTTNEESPNWLRQLVLGKPEPALTTPPGNATAQTSINIGSTTPANTTGAISSRTASPVAAAPQSSRTAPPALPDEESSWLNRLSWRKPASSRSPAATAQAQSAAKTPSRWPSPPAVNADARVAGSPPSAQPGSLGVPSIKRLPEIAQASVPSQPSTAPMHAAAGKTGSIVSAPREPRPGTLSSWFSKFQGRAVDQASAVTGTNTSSSRVTSRNVDSDIVFQGPPSTASTGVMRLPPPGAASASVAPQTVPGIAMLPAAPGTSRRSAGSITEQFTRDLVTDQPQSLVLAAPAGGRTTAERSAPAGPTSRRLPPPPETIAKSARPDAAGSPTQIPPTLSQVDTQPKLESPKTNPAASRIAQSITAGRSSLSAINPFSDYSAPRTIQDLHAEIIAQQPPVTPTAPQSAGPYARPKIIFRPIAMNAQAQHGHGHALLKPEAHVVAQGADATVIPPQSTMPDAVVTEDLPHPADLPAEIEYPMEEEWMPMGNEKDTYGVGGWKECWYRVLANLNGPRSCPPGIGVENVMNAPFWLETTQPLNNCRIRGDAAADWEFPDRLEYFWAKTPGPKGPQVGFPLGEPEIDYQEVNFYIERGGDRFSVGTELPIRAVDPEDRFNTTGFADMTVTPKMVLLDGKDWQLSHVFKTHIPTGSFRRGTGNGHVSLEPGVAWRYKWSDVTYFHGDLTYWFPIAADLDHAGQFLNYGIGISHVLYDSDCYAIMPTFEVNVWTLLDGRETLPRSVLFNEIDTYSVINLHPGLRIVCDTSGDCGVREFGISSGVAVTQEHWYEEIIRLELRWVF